MPVSKKKKAISEAIIREVKKEMAKPRMAESTRKGAPVDPVRKRGTPRSGINVGPDEAQLILADGGSIRS